MRRRTKAVSAAGGFGYKTLGRGQERTGDIQLTEIVVPHILEMVTTTVMRLAYGCGVVGQKDVAVVCKEDNAKGQCQVRDAREPAWTRIGDVSTHHNSACPW